MLSVHPQKQGFHEPFYSRTLPPLVSPQPLPAHSSVLVAPISASSSPSPSPSSSVSSATPPRSTSPSSVTTTTTSATSTSASTTMNGVHFKDLHVSAHSPREDDTAVAQALDIARESPEGARDPTVCGILESALSRVWGKVQAQPDSYVMTRDEFAVFNYFQVRFLGNKTAVAARARYWDNTHA